MSTTLLMLNALALAVLVAFHFTPIEQPITAAHSQPELRQAPQLAVMKDSGARVASLAQSAPSQPSQQVAGRLIF